MSRIPVFLLSLSTMVSAIETRDLAGMWKGVQIDSLTNMTQEVFFDADGSLDLRVYEEYQGKRMAADVQGAWYVRGDSLWIKLDSGWVQEETEISEFHGPGEFYPGTMELIASNPRILRSGNVDFVYQGDMRRFTLPAIEGGSSIRRPGKAARSRKADGIRGIVAILDGRPYDLLGRLGPPPRR